MGQCYSSVTYTAQVCDHARDEVTKSRRSESDEQKLKDIYTHTSSKNDGTSAKSYLTGDESSKSIYLEDISFNSRQPKSPNVIINGEVGDMSYGGISLVELKGFLKAHSSELDNLSSSSVYSTIIHPLTNNQKITYCDHLRNNGSSGVNSANVYICHAWESNFLEVCNAIISHFEKDCRPDADVFVWFDVFCFNYHRSKYPTDFIEIQNLIGNIGHTLLVLTSLSNPLPLQRCWCLLELYSTLSTQSKLEIASSLKCQLDSVQLKEFGSFADEILNINFSNSRSSRMEDKDMIFLFISSGDIGVSKLSDKLLHFFQSWTTETLKSLIDNEVVKQNRFDLKFKLAHFYVTQMKYDEAHKLYEECSELCDKSSGKRLISSCLANVFIKQGKHNLAYNLQMECIDGYSKYYSRTSVMPLRIVRTLAELHTSIKSYDQAVYLYNIVYDEVLRSCGPEHIESIIALCKLGCAFNKANDYSRAENILSKCLCVFKTVLGTQNIITIECMVNLAWVYNNDKEFGRSKSMITSSHEQCQAILEANSFTADTIPRIIEIAELYTQLGHGSLADGLLQQCYQVCTDIYGTSHPYTKLCLSKLMVTDFDMHN